MSHPNPSHDRKNEYPEDKVTHYPKKDGWKKHWKGKEDLVSMLGPKSKALKKKLK